MLRPEKVCVELESGIIYSALEIKELTRKQHKKDKKLHYCEDIVSSKVGFVCLF